MRRNVDTECEKSGAACDAWEDRFVAIAKDYLQATQTLRRQHKDNATLKIAPIVAPCKKHFAFVRSVLRDDLSWDMIDKYLVENEQKVAPSPIRFRARRFGGKASAGNVHAPLTNQSMATKETDCIVESSGKSVENGVSYLSNSPEPSKGLLDSVLWTMIRGISSSGNE